MRTIEVDADVFEALIALHLPFGVIAVDGRVTMANEQFCESVCGKPCGKDPHLCLEAIDDLGKPAKRDSLVHRDGRAFKLETARLAQELPVLGEDISQRLTDQTTAYSAARTDLESALPTRLMFRERLTELLQRRGPANGAAAVLVIGLGRIKAITTSLGRNMGAVLLRLVADRIRSTLASGDFLARVGDDEFAILQFHAPQPQSATALALRLVDLLARSYLEDGHLLEVDACIGVSVITTDDENCDKILDNADLALSQARRDGPRRYRFFEAAMDVQRDARRSLETDLRRALVLRELALVYQPQFNVASGRITGFEALLRWRHPKRGLVSPADFIPLAEELGLIVPFGEWVLRKACREAAKWPDRLRVAVNVSVIQFRSGKLCEQVSAALVESDLDPRRLELEITESALLGDHASVLAQLHRLREMGAHVSMDDFGTGYSSLSYLHTFPFDKIKIDQSFVRGTMNKSSSTAIIRAAAVLGQSLGMTTTAEGVETDEQLASVSEAGCTDIQGYLISRPLPPESIEPFLQSRKLKPAAE
jgi:diguanylate cyclase (GGDEF)-like protein